MRLNLSTGFLLATAATLAACVDTSEPTAPANDMGAAVVATQASHAELLGILWGGSRDNKSFVFSPLKNIRDELGAITATQ